MSQMPDGLQKQFEDTINQFTDYQWADKLAARLARAAQAYTSEASRGAEEQLLAEIEQRAPTLNHMISKEYNDGFADACMEWRQVLQALRSERKS